MSPGGLRRRPKTDRNPERLAESSPRGATSTARIDGFNRARSGQTGSSSLARTGGKRDAIQNRNRIIDASVVNGRSQSGKRPWRHSQIPRARRKDRQASHKTSGARFSTTWRLGQSIYEVKLVLWGDATFTVVSDMGVGCIACGLASPCTPLLRIGIQQFEARND